MLCIILVLSHQDLLNSILHVTFHYWLTDSQQLVLLILAISACHAEPNIFSYIFMTLFSLHDVIDSPFKSNSSSKKEHFVLVIWMKHVMLILEVLDKRSRTKSPSCHAYVLFLFFQPSVFENETIHTNKLMFTDSSSYSSLGYMWLCILVLFLYRFLYSLA